MSSIDVSELPEALKKARELSLVGSYQDSLKRYDGILKFIKSRIRLFPNSIIQDKWKALEYDIYKEVELINILINVNKSFKISSPDLNAKNKDEEYNQILMRDYPSKKNSNNNMENPKINIEIGNQQPKRYPFGNKPFAYLNNNDDNERNDTEMGNLQQQGNFKDNLGDNFFKRQSRGSMDTNSEQDDKNLKNQQKRPSKKQVVAKNAPSNNKQNVDIEKKRNYEKPWKVEDKKNDTKPKNEEKDKSKSTYLLSVYPEGVGPDSDLIDTLEREVVDTSPCVKFEDIAELDQAKGILKEAVLLPILMPQYFTGIRRPWKGVLLYGPPGTGKTMLAKALATQGCTTFFNVHAASFASKWRGESEKLVRILFDMARFYSPTTIFIDEVDSIGSKRSDSEHEASRRVKAELLVQMDGVSTNAINEQQKKIVMVLGATNRPWDLDEALRRRFEKRIYIPLPNKKGREELIKLNLKGVKIAEDIDFSKLVDETEGYSGADIANVCREASLMPMRRRLKNNQGNDLLALVNNPIFNEELNATSITMQDLLESLKNISKSVSKTDLDVYDKWTEKFASV